jgi:hypothetical protein
MRNGVAPGVTSVPPHEFEVPSEWYYGTYGVRKSEFGEINYGITSIQKFIIICVEIL